MRSPKVPCDVHTCHLRPPSCTSWLTVRPGTVQVHLRPGGPQPAMACHRFLRDTGSAAVKVATAGGLEPMCPGVSITINPSHSEPRSSGSLSRLPTIWPSALPFNKGVRGGHTCRQLTNPNHLSSESISAIWPRTVTVNTAPRCKGGGPGSGAC